MLRLVHESSPEILRYSPTEPCTMRQAPPFAHDRTVLDKVLHKLFVGDSRNRRTATILRGEGHPAYVCIEDDLITYESLNTLQSKSSSGSESSKLASSLRAFREEQAPMVFRRSKSGLKMPCKPAALSVDERLICRWTPEKTLILLSYCLDTYVGGPTLCP